MPKKFICGLITFGSFGFSLLGADDAFVGTWKLNEAKSHFAKGSEFKDSSMTITREGDTVKVTFHATDAEGKTLSGKYSVPSAGGTPAYTEGGPPYGMDQAIKRIDGRNVDVILSKDGKPLVTERFTVSANRKTIIGKVSGVDDKGTPIKDVEVYDRQ